MQQLARFFPGYRLRDLVLAFTALGHLVVATGLPLPVPSRKPKDTSIAYPCQSRPCGCTTAAECWKGDCCCYTLEEKLAWAESNGIEPPDHVRPAVEARRGRTVAPKKKTACCSESGCVHVTSAPRSCRESGSGEEPACCSSRHTPDDRDPKVRSADESRRLGQQTTRPADPVKVRWVNGLFAKKCRGGGSDELLQFDPAIPPDGRPLPLTAPDPPAFARPGSELLRFTTFTPPVPPPRHG